MILDDAFHILENIVDNSYSSENYIEEQKGIYRTNCSGIIIHLLKKNGISLPFKKAYEYFDFFKNSDYQKIERIDDLAPGDLIIWRKNNIPKKGTTGHMALCVGHIDKTSDRGTIRVFDCVKMKHDNDTRRENGIGLGDLVLLHEDGVANGFIWSSESSKTKYTEVLIIRLNS